MRHDEPPPLPLGFLHSQRLSLTSKASVEMRAPLIALIKDIGRNEGQGRCTTTSSVCLVAGTSRGSWYIGSGMKDEVIPYPMQSSSGAAPRQTSLKRTPPKVQHAEGTFTSPHDHVGTAMAMSIKLCMSPGCQPSSHSTGKLSSRRTGQGRYIFASPSFHIILALPRP